MSKTSSSSSNSGSPVTSVALVILLSEVAAALSRGIGDPTLAQRVVQQLARSEVIELIPVTLAMAERAALIAAEHRIRGCDADV